jgi:hypothetical protein
MTDTPPTCPHCGEPIDSAVDLGGGEHQSYIEDCAVCCRPMLITAWFDPDTNEFQLEASPEV